MNIRSRITRLSLSTALATTVVAGVAMPRAEAAVDPATIIGAAKAAYGAYQLVNGEDDVAAATTKIINAVNSAKSQILAHIDALASVEAEACASNAVSKLANMGKMNPDVAQDFAGDTDYCVNVIKGLIGSMSDKAAVDRAGFALNAVGPIALVAAANVGWNDSFTKSSLRLANQSLISKLYPSCSAAPLYGDAQPGGMVEVMLRCRAYNGDIGTGTAFTTSPRTATYNFTVAANKATRNTSRAMAQAVLPKI